MKRDREVEDWIERAKATDIWRALDRCLTNHGVKRKGHKGAGPCPACGGKDRFSINGQKQNWWCRKSQKGGGPIDLAMYVTGANFLGACEILTGESMPKPPKPGEEVRREDPKLVEQRRLDAEAEAERRKQEQIKWRDRERNKARDIWGEGEVLIGTPAEEYLRSLRGVQPPEGARLRYHPNLKYWHSVDGEWTVLHTGPALLARIDDNQNRFIGCHCTYIDLSRRKGKVAIIDPATGEVLDAKKVRGSQKGGHIHLGGSPAACDRLIMGEGIETTLSMREAMVRDKRDVSTTLFWAAVNLGNIGGPAAGSIVHPTARIKDKLGRERKVKVAGPDPDMATTDPVLIPPDNINRIVLLGDSDGDLFATGQHLLRAGRRWRRPGRETAIAWPDGAADFNDILLQGAGA